MTTPSKTPTPKEALESIIEYDGGHNIMGEFLCPICSNPISTPSSHDTECPFLNIKAAIPVAELHEQIMELLENNTLLAFGASVQKIVGMHPNELTLLSLRKDYKTIRDLFDKLEALKCNPETKRGNDGYPK